MNVLNENGTYPNRSERLKEITDRLEAGIANLFNSESYAAYLTAMSKFHRYSYGNIVLILSQRPEASQVAGLRTWNSFGRSVKKGEHGIQILMPCSYTTRREKKGEPTQNTTQDENGQEVQNSSVISHLRFKIGYVFDISQTEGREIPDIVRELSGDVAQYEAVCTALRECPLFPLSLERCPTVFEEAIITRTKISQSDLE